MFCPGGNALALRIASYNRAYGLNLFRHRINCAATSPIKAMHHGVIGAAIPLCIVSLAGCSAPLSSPCPLAIRESLGFVLEAMACVVDGQSFFPSCRCGWSWTWFLRQSHRAIASRGTSSVVATVVACHGVAGVGASHVGPTEDAPWEQAHGRYDENGATEEEGRGPCGTDGW